MKSVYTRRYPDYGDNALFLRTGIGFMRYMIVRVLFRRSVLPVLITLSVVFSAVSSQGPADYLPANDRSVTWKAVTEFGGFDITLSPDLSHITYISLRLERYRCGGLTITGDINAESRDIWPIVDNTFEIDTNLGVYRIIICGVFDDAGMQVYGAWQIHFAGKTCSGDWQASRK